MSGGTRDLVAALRERDLVHQVTDPDLGALSAREPLVAYIGFDPSAPSLHAGSLYQVMLLAHAARAGHRPIALLGGGTGLIGDPSGKAVERPLPDPAGLEANLAALRKQIAGLLERAGAAGAEVLDNGAWLREVRLVDFLRNTGKHFTVNSMVAKESVRARLEDREQGISFTEFAYMLLQAYDFLRLHEERGCRLQMGGSDQWGNITAGIELIRRRAGGRAFGITSPLLTTPSGEKFGKSVAGAVWLDPALTTPYEFHQFWMNQSDAQAAALLAPFTFLGMDEVAALRAEAAAAPERRLAQRRLADEVTTLVHGGAATEQARGAAAALFGAAAGPPRDRATRDEVLRGVPVVHFPRMRGAPVPLVPVLAHPDLGLATSASDARRLLAQGSIQVNGRTVPAGKDAPAATLSRADLLDGDEVVLRRGKKQYGRAVFDG